jgi:ribosome-associated translation inhibitor RaiA
LEASGWLSHIRAILAGACKVVDCIQRQQGVLVHCSDGWDRTAQLCALAQLLLDPYYRTIDGFQVLIEKDFVSFGHKFTERIGHVPLSSVEVSPVFLQFIDCVFQVWKQFPSYFEFNELFLITILDHLYSCLFGNFLHNSDKERHLLQVKQYTVSLWTCINAKRHRYLNAFYGRHTVHDNTQTPYDFHQSDEDTSGDDDETRTHNCDDFNVVLNPDCNIETLTLHFWTGYFTRHSSSVKNKYYELIKNALNRLERENKRMKTKYSQENKKRKELEKELKKKTLTLQETEILLNETTNRMITFRRIAEQSGQPIIVEENNPDGVILTKISSHVNEEEKSTVVMCAISSDLVVENYF